MDAAHPGAWPTMPAGQASHTGVGGEDDTAQLPAERARDGVNSTVPTYFSLETSALSSSRPPSTTRPTSSISMPHQTRVAADLTDVAYWSGPGVVYRPRV